MHSGVPVGFTKAASPGGIISRLIYMNRLNAQIVTTQDLWNWST
jgi:hypothetical protein